MSSPEQCAMYYSINRDEINHAKRIKYHSMPPEQRARRLEQMKVVVKRIEQAHNRKIGRVDNEGAQ